jgi:hypothetical protein
MILRSAVLALGLGSMAAGLIGLAVGGFPPALWFAGFGLLLVVGTAYERIRYKPLETEAPRPDWRRTPERFLDPQTNRPVTVYADASGERHYVQV